MFKIDEKFFEEQWVVAVTAEFGAVGQLAVIHLITSLLESERGYWRPWSMLDRQSFLARVPGLTLEVLDALIERLAEYDVVCGKKLSGSRVLTSAYLQRLFVKQCGVGRARRLEWLEYACLTLHELLELGVVPAERPENSDELEAPPGTPLELPLRHPDRGRGWRWVRVGGSGGAGRSGLWVYRLTKEQGESRTLRGKPCDVGHGCGAEHQ